MVQQTRRRTIRVELRVFVFFLCSFLLCHVAQSFATSPLFFLGSFLLGHVAQGFSNTHRLLIVRQSALQQLQQHHHTFAQLNAVKKKKPSRNSGASSGGGFGASASTTASTASGISGHSGSGAKALRQAANRFDVIRKQHQDNVTACCRDVYVRSLLNSPTTFWFVGKIAREPNSENDANDDKNDDEFFAQAAIAQKRVILEYSKDQLRPQNLGGKYASSLELWLAPADSEMDVATNKASLQKVGGSASGLPATFQVQQVGYNPEIYVGDERAKGGLRVERDENGDPTKAAFDVNQSM